MRNLFAWLALAGSRGKSEAGFTINKEAYSMRDFEKAKAEAHEVKPLAATAPDLSMRTWTSTSGRTIHARFVRMEVENVALKRDDGTHVTIPIMNLVKDDQILALRCAAPKLSARTRN